MLGAFLLSLTMIIIDKFQDNLTFIKKNIPIWIKDALFENAEAIIHLLQENQLSKGLDASGSVVGVYWWETEHIYAKDPQKKPRKPKTKGQPYNFEWSGELFDSMNLKINVPSSEFDIYSTTGKDKFVEKNVAKGADIMTLTKENNDWVNQNIIEPYLVIKIQENLFNF